MMDIGEIADALLCAADLATEVMRRERSEATIRFKNLGDRPRTPRVMAQTIVTSADLAAQEAILRLLLDIGMASFDIAAEESTPAVTRFSESTRSAGTLFIDPIDGTLSYAMGSPSFESAARQAGFSNDTIKRVQAERDPRMYGLVLGVEIPGSGIASVCGLPELGITYHAINDRAFRQRLPLKRPPTPHISRWVISSSILDSPTPETILPAIRGIQICRSGSNPGALWHLLEGHCTGYVAVHKPFDGQLAALVARAAGLLVTDKDGTEFLAKHLRGCEDSLLWAFTRAELRRISNVVKLSR